MVDEVTTGRGYQKPHPANHLDYDVHRLRAGTDKIDTDVVAIFAALGGKAATGHNHSIEEVSGLTLALSGKAASAHNHALAALSDVTTTGAATGAVLRLSGGVWTGAQLAVADISNLQQTLASMQEAITTIDDGSY